MKAVQEYQGIEQIHIGYYPEPPMQHQQKKFQEQVCLVNIVKGAVELEVQ